MHDAAECTARLFTSAIGGVVGAKLSRRAAGPLCYMKNMQLSVRAKVLITIVASVLILSALLYVISTQILLSSYESIERIGVIQDVRRANDAIDNFAREQTVKLRDWAQWDDAYYFGLEQNQEFIDSTIVDTALANLDINLMLFTDTTGNVIAAKTIDLMTGEAVPEGEIAMAVSAERMLATHPNLESSTEGMLLLPQGPIIVASRPLSRTDGTGPSSGSLIFGRMLDDAKVEELSAITHLAIDIFPYDATDLPEDVREAREHITDTAPYYVTPLSATSIGGYSFLKDLNGRTILIMRVIDQRPVYAQGQATFSFFLFIAGAAFLGFGVAVLLLLEQFVIARLARLSREVTAVSTTQDLSKRATDEANDEVGKVAGAVNELLASLSSSRKAEEASSTKAKSAHDELEVTYRQMERMSTVMVDREVEIKKLKAEVENLRGGKA